MGAMTQRVTRLHMICICDITMCVTRPNVIRTSDMTVCDLYVHHDYMWDMTI